MADRFQGRPSSSDRDSGRDGPAGSSRIEGDPLAELARLIGQTDPMSEFARGRPAAQPAHAAPADAYEADVDLEEPAPSGPPPWVQRAARQQPAEPVIQPVHPLHRYAAPPAPEPEPEPAYHDAPAYADHADTYAGHDPNRYDDALYGQPDEVAGYHTQQPARYPDDPYTYGDTYADDGAQDDAPKARRGGLMTVGVVLALAVIGTGGAFAYRTYVGSPRSGEPPVIKADNSPTKVVPAPAGDAGKVMDRMAAGDATEKLVPREEQPVSVKDAAAASGPRVVFPPLNPNANPPSTASVSPNARPPATAANGTLPGDEPRRIKTLTVRGDQVDAAASPVARPAVAAPKQAPRPAPANANASANAPLSLAPQAADTTRVASNNPVQTAPVTNGGYVVQISSQRSEADAQASYRALQNKFPSVLGSRSPLIRRADLGDKGVYYRAMVGPFGSPDEASQFCGSLKSAGGQCVVQRN